MTSKRDPWEENKFNLFIASIILELYKLEREVEREFEREPVCEVVQLLKFDKDFIFLEKFLFIILVLAGQCSVTNKFSIEISWNILYLYFC